MWHLGMYGPRMLVYKAILLTYFIGGSRSKSTEEKGGLGVKYDLKKELLLYNYHIRGLVSISFVRFSNEKSFDYDTAKHVARHFSNNNPRKVMSMILAPFWQKRDHH